MARELSILIKADGRQAKTELGSVEKSVQGVETAAGKTDKAVSTMGANVNKAIIGIAGAFAALNIGQAAKKAVDSVSQIADASQKMGIGAEALQRLKFAAEQGGSSLEAIGTAFGQMANNLGGKNAGELLERAGLTLKDIKGLNAEQTFVTIADAIGRMPDPLKQADVARDIFGRGAMELLPAMKAGFEDVGKQITVIPENLIKAGDVSGDRLHAIEVSMDNLRAKALLPLAEGFTTLPESVQIGILGIGQFVPSLETLVLAIIAAGGPVAAIGALKAAAVGVGTFFSTSLPALFAGGITFLTTTLPAAFASVIAFLGPQGLIALAVLALLGVWYFFGDEISAVVSKVYAAIKTWLVDTWGNVRGWISGHLTAVTGYFSTFKTKAVDFARLTYEGVKTWLIDKFAGIVSSIKGKIDAVTGFFGDMYDKVVGHSFVPDMVRIIGAEFGKLDRLMTHPTQAATNVVEGLFEGMTKRVSGLLDGWISAIAGKFGGLGGIVQGALSAILNSVGGLGGLLSKIPGVGGLLGGGGGGGALGGLIGGGVSAASGLMGLGALGGPWGAAAAAGAALIGSGIEALGNHLKGGEEGMYVNPRRDAFSAQFGGPGFDEGSAFVNLGNMLNSIGRGDLLGRLSGANEVQEFEGVEQVIVDLLRKSGFGDFRVFHAGGMVPGVGNVPAILQGGERVLSRAETTAYNRAAVGESGLSERLLQKLDELISLQRDGSGDMSESLDALRRELPKAVERSVRTGMTLARVAVS